MKTLIKDSCPVWGHQFGFRGASFRLPYKKRIFSKPAYYCQNCEAELKRDMTTVERMASIIGYAALLIASSASIWKSATLSEIISKEWMMVLYGVSLTGIGIYIISALTRQHYVSLHPTQYDSSSDAKSGTDES